MVFIRSAKYDGKKSPVEALLMSTYNICFVCLFVLLRFYSPVNLMGSCLAQSVYLTTLLLDRLSPLSGEPVLCIFFCQKNMF